MNGKLNKCPVIYQYIDKKTKKHISNLDLNSKNINQILSNYDIISDENCCKDKNDAEIDVLISIIKDNIIGKNIYEKYKNIKSFLDDKFLNSESKENISNYGFFSIDKWNEPIPPCNICATWLNNFKCNSFICIPNSNFIRNIKYDLNLWIPIKHYFTDYFIFKYLNIKTSLCNINHNIILKEKKDLEDKRKTSYNLALLKDNTKIFSILDILRKYNYNLNLQMYNRMNKKKKIKTNYTYTIIENEDDYNIILNKFINFNKNLDKIKENIV